MDSMNKVELADALRCLRSVASDNGYETAVRAMESAWDCWVR